MREGSYFVKCKIIPTHLNWKLHDRGENKLPTELQVIARGRMHCNYHMAFTILQIFPEFSQSQHCKLNLVTGVMARHSSHAAAYIFLLHLPPSLTSGGTFY